MTNHYQAVGWNRQKRVYDLTLAGAIALYLAAFLALGALLRPHLTVETLLIRAFGTAAFLLLHVTLCIGPLARLDERFLPLLYNRRHLGVATFLLGLAHGVLATVQFHALGNVDPLVSLFLSNPRYDSLTEFPFQVLGLAALSILFLMAATSHDFWLRMLSAPVWKSLHMMVYVAYGLLVLHVALGALQSVRDPALTGLLITGAVTVFGLQILAGSRERAGDRNEEASEDGWITIGAATDIPDGRAVTVSIGGERVAVFRNGDSFSAVSNVCKHQNGPLGEGRIVDGCITCPWHGYQYLPHNGSSPPPFDETLPTFDIRLREGRIEVFSVPHAPGTPVEPARLEAT